MTQAGNVAAAISPAGDALAAAHDAGFDHVVAIGADHSHDRPLDAARRRAEKAAETSDARPGP